MKNNLANMMCLDVYLSSLTNEEYKKIKHKLETPKPKSVPLLSSDIFVNGYQKQMIAAKKDMELQHVLLLAKKFNWKNDLNLAFSENDYEALIITDKNQNIIWVNDGFTSMTGYSKKFAINKTPKFLQGENTSTNTRSKIKEKISKDLSFKGTLVNYRKDKTAYDCEVTIIPLYDKNTTHFIAFEKQVV